MDRYTGPMTNMTSWSNHAGSEAEQSRGELDDSDLAVYRDRKGNGEEDGEKRERKKEENRISRVSG